MIIKFKPVFMDKIWGGKKLKQNYNYNVSDTCGECWGISAHDNGLSVIENTKYQGMTLKDLYKDHRELFGNYQNPEFPILVKIVDASKNLSIQVHPNSEYAKRENSLGKEECWLILDAEPQTEIIIGHKALSKDDFIKALDDHTVEELCSSHSIKKGDFFYIETGTLHSIKKGTTLLEVQQSSDITYRVYDYKRLENGKLRELHIDKALDVLNIPDKGLVTSHINNHFNYEILTNTTLKSIKAHHHGDYIFIMEGQGSFNKTPVKKGDFLMVTAATDYQVFGNMQYQKTTF